MRESGRIFPFQKSVVPNRTIQSGNFVHVCVCVLNVAFFFDGKFGGREYDSLVGRFDSSGI